MAKFKKLLTGISTSSLALVAANASATVVCACGRSNDVVICVCQVF